MTRTKKTFDTPPKGGVSAPERSTRPLSSDLQAHIGIRLKAFYDSVLSEPIPDRFAELLDRLDAADGSAAGSGAGGGRAVAASGRDDAKSTGEADGTADGFAAGLRR